METASPSRWSTPADTYFTITPKMAPTRNRSGPSNLIEAVTGTARHPVPFRGDMRGVEKGSLTGEGPPRAYFPGAAIYFPDGISTCGA
jgi:hypothetical protein